MKHVESVLNRHLAGMGDLPKDVVSVASASTSSASQE